MAPVVMAVQSNNTTSSKIKRPVPPGIQTNGVNSSKSSPSPSMSAKPPPSSSSNNANGLNGVPPRPASRVRKDMAAPALGRGQRSAGLRSASLVPDSSTAPAVEAPPYIIDQKYILKKYAGNPPSLIVHMHPTHFRFDQQEDMFQYNSPMRIFLQHLRNKTVPHEMLDQFNAAGVPFYEGCLIVQVYDHKSVAQSKEAARPSSASSKTVPFSLHNYSPYITPSPYVPYPKESLSAAGQVRTNNRGSEPVEKTEEEKDREIMPAPGLPTEGQKKAAPQPNIITIVLFPTQQALQKDLVLKAVTPRGASDGRQDGAGVAQTPGIPPTPTGLSMPPPAKRQKREHTELDGTNLYAAEGEILLATMPVLDLEPTRDAEETIQKLESQAHPEHSEPPPQPKARKRTVAEMAADEAHAADQERYMLTLYERAPSKYTGGQGAANGGEGDGQAGGVLWEPRFERFKLVEQIKEEHKKKDAEKRAELEAQQALQKQRQQQVQQQQAEQQAQLVAQQAQQRATEDRQRQEQAARERQRQEQQQRALQARAQAQAQAHAQAQAQAQVQQAHAQAQAQAHAQQNALAASMAQAAHGHPAVSGAMANGLANGMQTTMAGQAQARFHQVSQAQVSSPIVGQNTPQNMSSPMVGHVAMQRSTSSMAGSPPRPPSVVNHQPMSTPMAVSMSARGSQQSHPSGTPRMPNATPNMAHTPMSRPQVMPTPRMTQGSPPPNMMSQAQQVGQAMLMNGQALPPQMQNQSYMAAQIAAQQQRLQQHQQHQQAVQNGMMPGTPNAQHLAAQQQMVAQQRAHQQMMLVRSQQMMGANPQAQLAQRYQQQLNSMQMQNGQMQSPMQRQMAGMQGAGMVNVNGFTPQQQLALMQQVAQQQQAQQQQQVQQQQQAQQQQQQQQQQMGQGAQGQQLPAYIQVQIQQHQRTLFDNNLAPLAEKFGALQNIPPNVIENLKKNCFARARAMVMANINQINQNRMMAQQQGMNGMMGPGQ